MRYVSNHGEPVFDVVARHYITDHLPEQDSSLEDVFAAIYRTNKWGSTETRSGSGSERERMETVAEELSFLMHRWSTSSLLDAPCGEFNWMRDVDLDLNGVTYVGADIVPELIDRNRQKFDFPFLVADITKDKLPKVDLVLGRDALVHLSNQHASAALANFKKSGSRYLLATTFTETAENADIVTGWWRPLNLMLPPFDLPGPLDYIKDADSDDFYGDKVLALWQIT